VGQPVGGEVAHGIVVLRVVSRGGRSDGTHPVRLIDAAVG